MKRYDSLMLRIVWMILVVVMRIARIRGDLISDEHEAIYGDIKHDVLRSVYDKRWSDKLVHRVVSGEEYSTLEDVKVMYLQGVLEGVKGNRHDAALVAGVSERTMYRFIKQYKLDTYS